MPFITFDLNGERLTEYLCDMCEVEPATITLGICRALRMAFAICESCQKRLPAALTR